MNYPPFNLYQLFLHSLHITAVSHFGQITGSYANKWQTTHSNYSNYNLFVSKDQN